MSFYVSVLESVFKDFIPSNSLPQIVLHLIRLVSSVIEKANESEVRRLLDLFIPHFEWLMADKLGNACTYKLLQLMFESNKFQEEKEIFLRDLHLLYSRKFRKYALLKILKMKDSDRFIESVVDGLVRYPDNVMNALKNDASTYLLIGTILRITDTDKLRHFKRQVMRHSRLTSVQYNQSYLTEMMSNLDRWISYLEYFNQLTQDSSIHQRGR